MSVSFIFDALRFLRAKTSLKLALSVDQVIKTSSSSSSNNNNNDTDFC